MDVAHGEERGADFLRGDLFTMLASEPEGFLVVRNRFLQRANGDSQMIDASYHGRWFGLVCGPAAGPTGAMMPLSVTNDFAWFVG